jgi:hypothetical protein
MNNKPPIFRNRRKWILLQFERLKNGQYYMGLRIITLLHNDSLKGGPFRRGVPADDPPVVRSARRRPD